MNAYANHPSQPTGGATEINTGETAASTGIISGTSSTAAGTPDTKTAKSKNDRPRPISTFPEPTLRVRPWRDPVLDELGHDPRSLYVEQYWLPILGPTATLLLRRVALAFEDHPDGFELECSQWAQDLGIGMRGGKNGPFWRALDRSCRFGTAQRNGDLLMVHPRLAPLSMHQVVRLPDHLRASHQQWLTRKATPPTQARGAA